MEGSDLSLISGSISMFAWGDRNTRNLNRYIWSLFRFLNPGPPRMQSTNTAH